VLSLHLSVLKAYICTQHLLSFPTRRSSDLYWGALTVGRLVAAALTSRFAPGKVLVFGLSVAVAALVGATYVPIAPVMYGVVGFRSEEHTSELQSRENLVCRLLLEKKKANQH